MIQIFIEQNVDDYWIPWPQPVLLYIYGPPSVFELYFHLEIGGCPTDITHTHLECKGVLYKNRVGVDLTRNTINPVLPSLLIAKGVSKYRPYDQTHFLSNWALGVTPKQLRGTRLSRKGVRFQHWGTPWRDALPLPRAVKAWAKQLIRLSCLKGLIQFSLSAKSTSTLTKATIRTFYIC